MNEKPEVAVVAVVMGSDSDLPQVQPCIDKLEQFQIAHDVRVLSAHRCPDELQAFVRSAPEAGYSAFIAAAGGAAHLAGVIASHTTLPVIGIPIRSPALSGIDSLYSTVQMPAGVPVATVAIGKAGAANAGILAAQIFSVGSETMTSRLAEHRASMREKVQAKAQRAHRSKRFE